MTASLTTQFDGALFDDGRYGFDVDVQAYVTMFSPTQSLHRSAGQSLVRQDPK